MLVLTGAQLMETQMNGMKTSPFCPVSTANGNAYPSGANGETGVVFLPILNQKEHKKNGLFSLFTVLNKFNRVFPLLLQ